MRTTEVPLFDEMDLAGRLTDMRIWLDQHRYEPSTFTYFFLNPGMKIRGSVGEVLQKPLRRMVMVCG